MSDKKKNSTGKKVAKGILGVFGVCLTAYTIHEVAKEYDSMVDKYNDLVDKYNENVDFIQSCTFYEVKDTASKEMKDDIKNNNLSKKSTTTDKYGVVREEIFDPLTGFTVSQVIADPNNVLDSDFESGRKELTTNDLELYEYDDFESNNG